jgi:hypothetical protein
LREALVFDQGLEPAGNIGELGFLARRGRWENLKGVRCSARGYCDGLEVEVRSALEKVHRKDVGGLEANEIAELHRLALRAYDACSAGDEFNARALFDERDRWRR